MNLSEKEQNAVTVDGKVYKVRPYFNRVLEVFSVFRDKMLTEDEKTLICLDLLVVGNVSKSATAKVFNEVYRTFIVPENDIKSSSSEKIVDFYEDAEYIYSSFLEGFGIDLFTMQDKLTWKKFLALFKGLPDKTKIKQIMSIRSRDIPPMTKYNAAEVKWITEMKQIYALRNNQEKENNFNSGISSLFSMLKQRAVSK